MTQRTARDDLGRFYIVGFGLLMLFDTLAQLSFKFAGEHALPLELSQDWLARVFGQPWIYGALLGYGGAFLTWMRLLQHAPIGPAFAASHLEIVAVLLLSGWLFGEHISALQWLGGGLILAGIVCLAFSEKAQPVTAAAPAPAAPAATGSARVAPAATAQAGGPGC
jgi:drug/metabolite transporter (DMT)-like permease